MPEISPNASTLIDAEVRRQRAKAVPAETEQRAVPRASIAELNAMDFETLRDRYLSSRRDERGPVTRFLDLLDAPRNTIFNVMAPGLARRAKQAGETGAFGQGKVYFSDVLGEAGIKPGIARAVVGFVGDVAFDPLTYLGPPGWGAKVVSKGGRAIPIRKGGVKALKAVQKGRTGGSEVERVIAAAAAAGRPVDRSKALADVLGGRFPPRTLAGRVGSGVNRILGGDVPMKGGLVSDFADEAVDASQKELSEAVSGFVQKYAKGTGPGPRIGLPKGAVGSAPLHVPFTDWGIYVPAFTPTAKAAGTAVAIAAAAKSGIQGAETARGGEQARTVAEMRKAREAFESLPARRQEFLNAHADDADAGTIQRGMDLFDEEERTLRASRGELLNRAKSILDTPEPVGEGSIPRVLALQRLAKESEDEARRLSREADRMRFEPEMHRIIGSGIKAHQDAASEFFERLPAQYMAAADDGTPIFNADPAVQATVSAKAKPILDRIDELTREQNELLGRPHIEQARGRTAADVRAELDAATSRLSEVTQPLRGTRVADERTHIAQEILQSPERFFYHGTDTESGASIDYGGFSGGGLGHSLDRVFAEGYDNDGVVLVFRREQFPGVGPLGTENSTSSAAALEGAEDQLSALVNPAKPIAVFSSAEARDLRSFVAKQSAPPEGMQFEDIKGQREAVRLRDLQGLSDAKRQIMATADSDIEQARQLAEFYQSEAKAAMALADTTRGSIASFLGPTETMLARVAAAALHSDDVLTGAAAMAPVENAARFAFRRDDGILFDVLGRIDRGKRQVFGQREGTAASVLRQHRYGVTTGAQQAQKLYVAGKAAELGAIAAAHGISRAQIPDLSALVMALMYRQQQARAGRAVVHSKKLGSEEPSELFAAIQKAVNDGWLNDKIKPGLAKQLEDFAAQNLDLLDTFREMELKSGALDSFTVREGYVPSAINKPAAQIIGRMKRQALTAKPGSLAARQAQAAEAFQHQRTTDQARFITNNPADPEFGKQVAVFEADRFYQSLNADELEQMGEQAKVRRARIDEYDSLPDRPPMLATDPWELNRLTHEGRFNLLLGTNDPPGQFFDTNAITAVANRLGQHERAQARAFFKEWWPSVTLNVSASKVQQALSKIGEDIDLVNGAKGRVVRLGTKGDNTARSGIRIGSDIYRPLDVSARSSVDNPIIDAIGLPDSGQLVHESVADAIENTIRIYDSDETMHRLAREIDRITNYWKSATLFHPSWFTFNLVGNTINFLTSDPHYLSAMAKYSRPVMKAVAHSDEPGALQKNPFTIKVGGEDIPAHELMEQLRADRIAHSGFWMEDAVATTANGYMVMPSRAKRGARGLVESFKPGALRDDFLELERGHAAGRAPSTGEKVKAGAAVVSDRAGRALFGPWFKINRKTDDVMRTVAYLSYRDQGWDHASAVNRVIRAGFDYSDLAKTERHVFRRLFPFYSWMRNNAAYQLRTFLERPIYAGSFPLLQNAIEEAINGNETVPQHLRPGWMKEQLGLQLGKDPDNRSIMLLGTALPQEQLLQMGGALGGQEGLSNFMQYLGGSLNPLARLPIIELAAGKEIYSDRTIGGDPMLSDLTPAQMVLGQIRPLREAGKLTETVQKQGVGAAAGRLALGGRFQPFDEERRSMRRLREFRDVEERLRRSESRSRYRKDDSGSLRARVQLMLLYRDMERAGYVDEIPKWARGQLEQLAAAN